MRFRSLAGLAVVAMVVGSTAVGAGQGFKPKTLPEVSFKGDPRAELTITMESAGSLPARLRHVSGKQALNVSARSLSVTYTAIGLTVDLKDGTVSQYSEPWESKPREFRTLQVQFGSNAEFISMREGK